MSDCPYTQQVSAYHDGELDAGRRGEMDRHLAQCPGCAAALEQLRSMSRWFADSQSPRLSQISLARVHRRVEAVMDEALVRTARILSVIAAAVLIVGSIWLVRVGGMNRSMATQVSSTPPWAGVSTSSDAETTTIAANTPAAQWYLADNSSRAEELP
jgi:anti-sigma factor RsiW